MPASTTYYPFGMISRSVNPQTYRFGFNGMEKDPEITGEQGSHYTAPFWEYDMRIGRRWNVDPVTYPWQSPYATFNDNPVLYADPDGRFGRRRDARNYKRENGISGRVKKGDDGLFYIKHKERGGIYHIKAELSRANADGSIKEGDYIYGDRVGDVSWLWKITHPSGGSRLKNEDFQNGLGSSRDGTPSETTEVSDLPGAPSVAKNMKLSKNTFEWIKLIQNAEKNAEKSKSIIDKRDDVREKNKAIPEKATDKEIDQSHRNNMMQGKPDKIYVHVYDSTTGVNSYILVDNTDHNKRLRDRGGVVTKSEVGGKIYE